MKSKIHHQGAQDADFPGHALFCHCCAKEIMLNQQKESIILRMPKEQIKFDCWKLLKITVRQNYCSLYVRSKTKPNAIERHDIRSTLQAWSFLEEFGLLQLMPNCILNLAHSNRVVKNGIYSKYYEKPFEVTKSHRLQVAKLLPIWSGLELL